MDEIKMAFLYTDTGSFYLFLALNVIQKEEY